MTWHPITEPEFKKALYIVLDDLDPETQPNFVTGPGRSGAIAAVYASHYLGIPFIPFKQGLNQQGNLLIVDTVHYTGATIQKALSWYERNSSFEEIISTFAMKEHRGHYYRFWYEE